MKPPDITLPKYSKDLKAGDILYGVTELALNTDVISPVIVTIVQGELKGARAIGEFKLSGESLVMSFNKIVTKDGLEIKVEALGIDPATSGADIQARVNTHFFERWGSLIAASFIEGFGEAVSRKSQRVYISGDTVVEDGLGKTWEEVSYESLGKVGSRAANQVEKRFDRPPTVTVRVGQSVAVLIISKG
jgi:intracellular multiplication protein IcmE